MPAELDLWQKSRGPVTGITGLFAVDCDVCHETTCDPALRQWVPEPRISPCLRAIKHASQWDRAFVSHPENSLAAVGSHARRTGPMAEVTRACDRDHGSFCRRL